LRRAGRGGAAGEVAARGDHGVPAGGGARLRAGGLPRPGRGGVPAGAEPQPELRAGARPDVGAERGGLQPPRVHDADVAKRPGPRQAEGAADGGDAADGVVAYSFPGSAWERTAREAPPRRASLTVTHNSSPLKQASRRSRQDSASQAEPGYEEDN